jgi:hypothetical protein
MGLGLALLGGMTTVVAQSTADNSTEQVQTFADVVFTAGTTTRDSAGRDWGYLLWQADKTERLTHRAFAVYTKTGDAAAPTPYVRRAVVSAQVDARSLLALVRLAANLGENEAELESQLNSLFQDRFSGSTLGLGEKLSAALRSSTEPEARENLEFLARTHPAVAMALGQAFALPLESATTTCEIRQWDTQSARDLVIIGRVTLTAGVPVILPPPGPPVQVPDLSPQGHLNARLRWGSSSLLNRFALLQHGFNLYRIPAAFALQSQFHVDPPMPTTLRYLVATTNAVQVNRLPLLAEEELSLDEAANLDPTRGGDAETFFITDDNRRFETGGKPFANGDQFYYFVTARDLLGRDGLASAGTLVTICDRRPPPLPDGLRVRNEHLFENGVGKQFLRLSWPAVRDGETGTNLVYRVYRWESPRELHISGRFPATNLIASVVPDAQCQDCVLSFTDRGPGSPNVPGKTYWYTIRVEDRAACGGNLSAHTGPVPGVLRDFTPPVSPVGQVYVQCGTPQARFKSSGSQPLEPELFPNPDVAQFRLHCVREDARVQWVDWYVSFGGPREFLGRQYFAPGATNVTLTYGFSRLDSTKVSAQKFTCQVGTGDGKVSGPAECQLQGISKPTEVRHLNFTADYVVARVAAGADCPHDPNPGNVSVGHWTPIDIEFMLPSAKEQGLLEWKLYRQIDAEPMSLIGQGTNAPVDALPVLFQDRSLPVSDATVCYFLSWVDEHGNPSPLISLGCVPVRGSTPMPVPVLGVIEPGGTQLDPRMLLRWFCPPYGVERFELWLSADGPLANDLGSQLSTNLIPTVGASRMGMYRTGRVGGDFASGPVFTLDLPVNLATTYQVAVRAVSSTARVGESSNVEEFTWHPVSLAGVNTPWPTRELPVVNSQFNTELSDAPYRGGVAPLGVAAMVLPATNGNSSIGIRIGEVLTVNVSSKGELYVPGDTDPLNYIYRTTSGLKLDPFVLYRHQVVNARFPKVSGDLTQVAPMLDQIAFQRGEYLGVPVVFLRDPFMTILPAVQGSGRPQLILRDTQPLVAGARYQYLLLHFGANGEPDQVIPTNEIELPSKEPLP